jgi:hypothetical protein
MAKKLLISLSVVVLAAFGVACSKSEEANSNANSSTAATTRTAPDNSEIMTSVDANGVKTETRTFRNNPRVSKVVVTTTRSGQRTVRVYSPSGEEKEVKDTGDNVLEATGEKVASAAGWTADKAEDAAGKTKDETKTVVDKTADTAKSVGTKTVEGAKTVGTKTAEGAKTVGTKTASTAKTVADKTVEGTKTATKEATKAVKKVIP